MTSDKAIAIEIAKSAYWKHELKTQAEAFKAEIQRLRADTEELAKLIADMRSAQKEYFRTRSDSALASAKALERRVDEAVKGILDSKQGMLFE